MKPLSEIKKDFLKKYHCNPDDENAVLIHNDALDELLLTVAIESRNHGILSAMPGGGHKPGSNEEFEILIGIREN